MSRFVIALWGAMLVLLTSVPTAHAGLADRIAATFGAMAVVSAT